MIKIKTLTNFISLPTLIIGGFWIFLLILGVFVDLPLPEMFSDGLRRFGRWGILTLAMVPAIQSGVGPNFALPLGIVCGLLGQVCAIVLNLSGAPWFITAALFAIVFAVIMGYAYGKLMNAVKGAEMAIATYTGFSVTMLFCILWLILPFKMSGSPGLWALVQVYGKQSNWILSTPTRFWTIS